MKLKKLWKKADLYERAFWIDLSSQGDSRFMCSACGWKENVPTIMGRPIVWDYCPSCGCRIDKGEENEQSNMV